MVTNIEHMDLLVFWQRVPRLHNLIDERIRGIASDHVVGDSILANHP